MAVPKYTYLKLKIPGPNGVITVGPSYEHAYECDVECVEHGEAILESATLAANLDGLANETPDPKRHVGNFKPVEDIKLVPLDPTDPKGKALSISATPRSQIGSSARRLSPHKHRHLCVESLGYAGIPREVAEHALEIRAGSKPVKQHLRRFDEEKRKVIGEEVHKLLKAGFIKEVHHLEWLANPVLVKKKNGKWRMCVDYTSLNKACPKVPFPLPRIDQIVDSTAGCETLSFLDAYSSYQQIKMKESDQLAIRSLPHLACIATLLCPSVSETQGLRTNDAYNIFLGNTLDQPSRPTSMISLSKPKRSVI
jgi:hypothetical protein